ncbi:MAG: carbon-nitrogen hydrolase family protein [Bauldia sp.]
MKVAVAQMRSGREVGANIAAMEALVRQAAAAGAVYVQTPEMTNIVERDRDTLLATVRPEDSDPTLARARELASQLGIHIHLGSLAVRGDRGNAANRSFLIGPSGAVIARYDKIHMFDVDLPGGESWRESRTYEPGGEAVVARLGEAAIGLSICYDLRFPHLYRALAQGGADILAVPSAFTRQTGEAHWHVLQRARAIENGAFVIAAAQGGRHADGRETFGHSIVVNPWGRILAEAGEEPGVLAIDIDLGESQAARSRIPALQHDRRFSLGADTNTRRAATR